MPREISENRWVPPSECLSFWSWLSYSWRTSIGWDGPHVKLYEYGTRTFGFERYRLVRQAADDQTLP